MNYKLSSLMLAAGLTTLTAVTGLAQTNDLRIYTAVEIEYPTEPGNAYTLQGSIGLTNWVDIGSPVFGNGRTVSHIFSTKNGAVNFATYRLLVAPAPTNGFAPWSIEGLHIQMEDVSSTNHADYLSSTNGQDLFLSGTDPFDYQYLRTGSNEGQVDRTYSPTRRDSVHYTFTGTDAGNWLREEYEQNVLKSRQIGLFHLMTAGSNTGPGSGGLPPAPPTSLVGLTYYAFTGSSPEKYQFNQGSGVATPGSSFGGEGETTSTGNAFTYTYSVLSSNTASLIVNFGYYGIGGDRQEYDLTFNDGPTALFHRRIYRLGSLFTTDGGVFSPNSSLPSTGGGGTTNSVPTTPPESPTGFTYTMNYGTTPTRVVFQNPAAGLQFDDSAPSSFTYTYLSSGTLAYHLVLTFRPGKWDEYDLTFTSGGAGTLVVHRYDNNRLKRTDGGTFSVVRTNP